MSSLESAITGALAGALANSLVYPLDVIKTILQTQLKQKEESQKEKKENNVTITAKDSETQSQNEKHKPVQSNKISRRYPQFKSSLECLLYIYKHEGFHGLYRGYNFSIISGIIQSFNYWLIYTTIRKYYYNRKLKYATNISSKNGLNSLEELLLGIISGSFSSVVTVPIGTIATSQKTKGLDYDSNDTTTNINTSIFEEIKDIYNRNGGKLANFYKGLKVSLILSCNPAITFAVFQKLQKILLSSISDDKNSLPLLDTTVKLPPFYNFICGVISKMCSTIITQPLIISKVLLQKSNSQFQTFFEVLQYLIKNEGILSLWKGVHLQLLKGVLVQGLVFMYKGELGKLVLTLRRLLAQQQRRRRVGAKVTFYRIGVI